jgi:hypothetical protein
MTDAPVQPPEWPHPPIYAKKPNFPRRQLPLRTPPRVDTTNIAKHVLTPHPIDKEEEKP